MEISYILDQLCGNRDKYAKIIKWIQQQLILPSTTILSFDNLLFVSGDIGIGKSVSIRKICEALDLHIVYITTSNCSSSDELNDLLIKHCSASMIQVLLNDKRRRIIIIDEFDSMMALDRTINLAIYNILNGNNIDNIRATNGINIPKFTKKKIKISNKTIRMIPIICITSSDIIKRIGNIKKKCQNIQLEKPTETEIATLLIQLGTLQEKALASARVANGNISQAIENSKIHTSYAAIDENIHTTILYDTNDKFDRDKIRKIILTDPWLIPLKYHENLISELDRRRVSNKNARQLYKNFMANLISYDLLIHNNAIDQAVDIFSSSVNPLSLLPLKKNAVSNMDNFTKILSYLSLQKKYTKNAYTGLYQIGSYHTNITGRNNMFFN